MSTDQMEKEAAIEIVNCTHSRVEELAEIQDIIKSAIEKAVDEALLQLSRARTAAGVATTTERIALKRLSEYESRAAHASEQGENTWLNEFHRINIARQHEAFAPAHSLLGLVACVSEEVGELASASLGVTGEKKRKASMTNADMLDAVADAITYLSLVADRCGCSDLQELLAATFNMVSDRAGSKFKVAQRPTPATASSPLPLFHCNNCGYFGDKITHEGCNYRAYPVSLGAEPTPATEGKEEI